MCQYVGTVDLGSFIMASKIGKFDIEGKYDYELYVLASIIKTRCPYYNYEHWCYCVKWMADYRNEIEPEYIELWDAAWATAHAALIGHASRPDAVPVPPKAELVRRPIIYDDTEVVANINEIPGSNAA